MLVRGTDSPLPLSTDDDRLIPSRLSLRPDHAPVRLFRDGKQVRLEITLSSAGVRLHDGGGVDGEGGEGIHGDEDDTTVGVDLSQRVPVKDRMQHYSVKRQSVDYGELRGRGTLTSGLIEVRQVGQILRSLEERGIAQRGEGI